MNSSGIRAVHISALQLDGDKDVPELHPMLIQNLRAKYDLVRAHLEFVNNQLPDFMYLLEGPGCDSTMLKLYIGDERIQNLKDMDQIIALAATVPYLLKLIEQLQGEGE